MDRRPLGTMISSTVGARSRYWRAHEAWHTRIVTGTRSVGRELLTDRLDGDSQFVRRQVADRPAGQARQTAAAIVRKMLDPLAAADPFISASMRLLDRTFFRRRGPARHTPVDIARLRFRRAPLVTLTSAWSFLRGVTDDLVLCDSSSPASAPLRAFAGSFVS
jgi:hypothetical protein